MAAKKNSVSEEQIKAYVDSQARAGTPIETKDLVCKDCAFRNDYRSGICDKFPLSERKFKPLKVLRGGPCSEYHKE